ncbi:MAG: hypothetical protein V4628_18140 [Pseudomonadota bacterium]
MMIHKAIVISFSLLVLPSLCQAQCANQTAALCDDAKATETAAKAATVDATENTREATLNTGEQRANNDAATTSKANHSSRKNKHDPKHNYPIFETADPRDTVLSSEICVYSSATYTYTCR